MNWKNIKYVVCPEGHINIVEKGETPKFCHECGLPIMQQNEIKKCSICGKPITKDLIKISNGMGEEYKDSGICIDCWVHHHPDEVEQAVVELEGKTL